MNTLCPNVINCPGTDNPFANLSSEAVDAVYWKSFVWGGGGGGGGAGGAGPIGIGDTPPLGYTTFGALACATVFNSTISQEDANEQAAIAALNCMLGGWTDPGGGHPTAFFNSPQSCHVHCPDGNPFTYTVGAGRFAGASQAQANQAAYSFACQNANSHRLCLSSITPAICLDVNDTETIYATVTIPAGSTIFWDIVAGSIPPGMTFNGGFTSVNYCTISGTPTAIGTYDFSVRCTAQNGDYMVKPYTLIVAGITNTLPLADGTVNVAYTAVQLTSLGFASPIYIVSNGALPAGMNLTAAGLLDGTPTGAGTFDFTVQIEEGVP